MKERILEAIGRALRTLDLVRRTLHLVWDGAGFWTAVWIAGLVLRGALPAAIVYLTKLVVDSVDAAIGSGVSWESAYSVLVPAGLMAVLLLTQNVLSSFIRWVQTAQQQLVQDHIKGLVHSKAAEVDFGFYESAAYHDLLEQARGGGRTMSILQNGGALLQSSVTLFSISAILFTYSLWVPIVLVVSTIPAFLVVLKYNRLMYEWWDASTEERRRAQYFDRMLTAQEAAAEVRIFSLGEMFIEGYQSLRAKLRGEHLTLIRKQAIAQLGAAFFTLLSVGLVMVWIIARAMRGQVTLGDVALFYQAFNQGQSMTRTLLQNAGNIVSDTLYMEHLFDFLSQENDVLDRADTKSFPSPVTDGWLIEDVTFTYPGYKDAALKNLNLEIPKRKIVAIVGENGAGKTTMIKLLCRFYDPDVGRISIDGVDLRDLAQSDLRRHISVMFQFPMKYQLTAAESIHIGDLEAGSADNRIEKAARAAGAHEFLSKLPMGYSSMLGRYFADGSELSGGQWQRVALARAFMRDAQLVILDEPTSFMDSWAESEWLKRFKRLVEDRTALIITHRFTTAMQADIIHVMDDGGIIESGTHAELLQLDGHYANSWRTQMEAGHVASRDETVVRSAPRSGLGSVPIEQPPGDLFDDLK